MREFALMLLAVLAASSARAQAFQPLPSTPEGNYELGQRFAHCSATFVFMAEIAKRSGFPDTVVAAEGQARGWKVTGLMFLVEGLHRSRQANAEETFDNLVQVKVEHLRARYELNPEAATREGPAEFERECRAWVPTQQKLIELMRRGPQ